MPKSLWTGRQSNNLISIGIDENHDEFFVEPEYREELEAYLKTINKWKKPFLILILSWHLVIVLLALTNQQRTLGWSLLVLSILLMVLPFPTPQTIRLLGAQKSILLVRMLALVVASLGIWIAIV